MVLLIITIFNMKVKEIKSTSEYLDMIRPYLSDIINDHKTQGE